VRGARFALKVFPAIKRMQSRPGQFADSVTLTLGARVPSRAIIPAAIGLPYLKYSVCLFSTSGGVIPPVIDSRLS
jgi:hypothetical protein